MKKQGMTWAQRLFSADAIQREFAARRLGGAWTSQSAQRQWVPEIECWVREDIVSPTPRSGEFRQGNSIANPITSPRAAA